MREVILKIILIISDLGMILFSLYLSYTVRCSLDIFSLEPIIFSYNYVQSLLSFGLLYVIIILLFYYEGLYTHRLDFWHESRQIIKALFFSLILMMAYLGMTQTIQEYSRFIIIVAFLFMSFLIPLSKNILKKTLFNLTLWQREAKIYGQDTFIREEIFSNPYLGYIEAGKKAKTVFINSRGMEIQKLRKIIEQEMKYQHEIIFIPFFEDYELTQSYIYELSNAHINLIVLQNNLNNPFRLLLKKFLDQIIFCIAFFFLLPIFVIIWYKIKNEEPTGQVIFKQERLGQNGTTFMCYKFRTMHEDGEDILKYYLEKNPEEVTYYQTYHKYQNDPRITKIGSFLRKTSLDELPQIFNIAKGDMSFVGPRPYMLNEKIKIGKRIEMLLYVKPGITGLWQVSGRNEVDFLSRVELDLWYIRNWNIWLDIVILLKTIKVVLLRKGAS